MNEGAFAWSEAQLHKIRQLEDLGQPFLCWIGSAGGQEVIVLSGRSSLTIGRRSSNDVVLSGDPEVSRVHARLELIAQDWTVVDDGLSRNGTLLNGVPIAGRRRLEDRDWIRLGSSALQFRACAQSAGEVTVGRTPVPDAGQLSATQRAILTALCRDYIERVEFPVPRTNLEIAQEVFLGVDAVKTHLRILFVHFGIANLPQNQKRTTLAAIALRTGLVQGLVRG